MKKSDQKRAIEFTFRNLLRTAELEDDPVMWEALIIWCRSKEGGRHKALQRKGDNAWCFDELPDKALLYDPMLMRKTRLPDMHPDPDPDYEATR
jgi:hypothetical protein